MIVETEKYTAADNAPTCSLGGRLVNAPYQDLSLHDLAEVYSFVLERHGRGIRLNLVTDELNRRDEEALSQHLRGVQRRKWGD